MMFGKKLPILVILLSAAILASACGGGDTAALESQIDAMQQELDAANAALEEAQAAAGEAAEAAEPVTFAGGGDTLAAVQGRGILNCGVHGTLPGFAFVDEDGSMQGFEADYCRALAAAVLGDPEAVEYRPSTSTERFPILQSGEIDVLIRVTTWTISRDTSLGFNFAPTIFYDGQGMMVRKDSGIETLEDMEGGTVCVGAGTTTEKNLADVFRSKGINYEAVVFSSGTEVREGYDAGRCDGFTTDRSGLVASQPLLTNPDDHVILEDVMSKEPLAPVVLHGDDNWYDIVKWVVNCTILGEELGVDSSNVDDMLGSDDPQVLNLLGVEGDLGQALGLNNDFCYQAIKQVGNYAELYNRSLGPGSPFDMPRALNRVYTEGGMLYSPPFR
jgi:general L-amino acid transport system substrate-binding protein